MGAHVRKAPDTSKFFEATFCLSDQSALIDRLSEGNPFKACANPQARDQKTSKPPLRERDGLNISPFKLFRSISCEWPIREPVHAFLNLGCFALSSQKCCFGSHENR